jgi:hypothetical protein
MMRNLLTVGAIAGFIASAFVTPTNANLSSMQAFAKDEVRTRAIGSLLGGSVPSVKDAAAAAKVLSAVATNPVLKSAAEKAIGSVTGLNDIDRAATVLTSVSTPANAKHIVKTVVRRLTAHTLTKTWKSYRNAADPFTRAQLERIEWALKKQDVRLCADVADAAKNRSDQAPVTLTPGDYLALCVAIVSGDEIRCLQIPTVPDSSLHSLCTEELATV